MILFCKVSGGSGGIVINHLIALYLTLGVSRGWSQTFQVLKTWKVLARMQR